MSYYRKETAQEHIIQKLDFLYKSFRKEFGLVISEGTALHILDLVYSENYVGLPLKPPFDVAPRLVLADKFDDLREQARYRSDHVIIILRRFSKSCKASDLLHEATHSLLWHLQPRPQAHDLEFFITYAMLLSRYLFEGLCFWQKGTAFEQICKALKLDDEVHKEMQEMQEVPELAAISQG